MTDAENATAVRIDESIRLGTDIAEAGHAPLGKAIDRPMLAATAAPTESSFRVFKRLLDAHGLRYALYSILRLTDYRFISLFAFEDGMIRSLAHVDREDLSILETESVAASASYCCYVRPDDGAFAVVDSLADPRVEGHVKQQQLRAYCGVPVLSAEGTLIGTLCHYDPVPRDPAQLNAELLALVVEEITRTGVMARRDH